VRGGAHNLPPISTLFLFLPGRSAKILIRLLPLGACNTRLNCVGSQHLQAIRLVRGWPALFGSSKRSLYAATAQKFDFRS
jgi:hypothetical protein